MPHTPAERAIICQGFGRVFEPAHEVVRPADVGRNAVTAYMDAMAHHARAGNGGSEISEGGVR